MWKKLPSGTTEYPLGFPHAGRSRNAKATVAYPTPLGTEEHMFFYYPRRIAPHKVKCFILQKRSSSFHLKLDF